MTPKIDRFISFMAGIQLANAIFWCASTESSPAWMCFEFLFHAFSTSFVMVVMWRINTARSRSINDLVMSGLKAIVMMAKREKIHPAYQDLLNILIIGSMVGFAFWCCPAEADVALTPPQWAVGFLMGFALAAITSLVVLDPELFISWRTPFISKFAIMMNLVYLADSKSVLALAVPDNSIDSKLLKWMCDLGIGDPSGAGTGTALGRVFRDDLNEFTAIIVRHPAFDARHRYDDPDSPLIKAIRAGDVYSLRIMLCQGIRLTQVECSSLMERALFKGSPGCVDVILQYTDPDAIELAAENALNLIEDYLFCRRLHMRPMPTVIPRAHEIRQIVYHYLDESQKKNRAVDYSLIVSFHESASKQDAEDSSVELDLTLGVRCLP